MRDGLVIDPAPAAFVVGAGDELSLGAPVVGSGHPHRLRLGPDEAESPVAFELAAVARIDEAVVGPGPAAEGVEVHHPSARRGSPARRYRRSPPRRSQAAWRSEEHTSELQSLMRISYADVCLKQTNYHTTPPNI